MIARVACALAALGLLACSGEDGVPGSLLGSGGEAGAAGGWTIPTGGGGGAAGGDAGGGSEPVLTSCNFTYDDEFVYSEATGTGTGPDPLAIGGTSRWSSTLGGSPTRRPITGMGSADDGLIAHAEPPPPYVWSWTKREEGQPSARDVSPDDLVMPGYSDDMPLFERATAWTEPERCFETPVGVRMLTEDEAYDLYRAIAELTTGIAVDDTPEHRSVLGLRGGYPGRLLWNDNKPNRFNDTLVLLWVDTDGAKHVRELPVNTDTGAHDFGADSSSSLRPNRRYFHINGWHSSYNALHVDEYGYRVRDDHNTNGHWDSDRNGWLPPLGSYDHDRTGGGHNIHMGSVDAPLGSAEVDVWSAGCQVIPGIANWTEFITHAWTEEGDRVEYFLVDVRDIASDVWEPCDPDGSHRCPYRIDAFPFVDSRSTASEGAASFDVYNCSGADEGGAEIVYLLTLDESGTLTVDVDCPSGVDVDVHLLDGDDANACLARDDTSLSYDITPGRYFVVADSYVSDGQELSGSYTLTVDLAP